MKSATSAREMRVPPPGKPIHDDPVLAGPGSSVKSHRADCDPLPVMLAELVECPPMVLQNGPKRPPGEEDDRCATSARGLLSQRAEVRQEHEPASPFGHPSRWRGCGRRSSRGSSRRACRHRPCRRPPHAPGDIAGRCPHRSRRPRRPPAIRGSARGWAGRELRRSHDARQRARTLVTERPTPLLAPKTISFTRNSCSCANPCPCTANVTRGAALGSRGHPCLSTVASRLQLLA